MFKLNKLVIAVLATATIGVATIATQSITNPTTVSAHAVQADGPWEKADDGTNWLQRVNNGNQIYFSIDPNSAYQKYAKNAAADWNALGVVDLVQVPWGDSRSQIQVTSDLNSSESADENGNTNFGQSGTNDPTKDVDYFDTTTITWYDMSDQGKLGKQITADHEFGHALGFAHDNRHLNNGHAYQGYTLTMNGTTDAENDTTYALGGIEQRTLAHHYGITPAKWLNTNC